MTDAAPVGHRRIALLLARAAEHEPCHKLQCHTRPRIRSDEGASSGDGRNGLGTCLSKPGALAEAQNLTGRVRPHTHH